MYAYAVEELAWATAREREEEARQTRPHTEDRPQARETLGWRLGRMAVWAGAHVNRAVRGSTPRPAGNGCS